MKESKAKMYLSYFLAIHSKFVVRSTKRKYKILIIALLRKWTSKSLYVFLTLTSQDVTADPAREHSS